MRWTAVNLRPIRSAHSITWGALLVALTFTPSADADPKDFPPGFLIPDPDVVQLKKAKIATDDAGLVKFLESLHGPNAKAEDIAALVARLDKPAEREAALKELTRLGSVALPALRRRLGGADNESLTHVRKCVAQIELEGDRPLARLAIRKLLRRKSPVAISAFLGYLPFAGDVAAVEDIWYGVDALLDHNPKQVALIPPYLNDPQPARRALAACLLGRRGTAEQKRTVQTLLKDADPEVRLRAAQGPLAGRDSVGVPTLIELLADDSIEIRWQAEELMRWLAVDTAPKVLAGPEPKRAADEWRAWWKKYAGNERITEAEAIARRPILLLGFNEETGKLTLFGCDGAPRCEWDTKRKLVDAQYVPGGTILTLHDKEGGNTPRLAELNRSGERVMTFEFLRSPKHCQRLANGQVFVAEYENARPSNSQYSIVEAGGELEPIGKAHRVSRDFYIVRQEMDGQVLSASIFLPESLSRSVSFLIRADPVDGREERIFNGWNFEGHLRLETIPEGGYVFSGLRTQTRDSGSVSIVELDQLGDTAWKLESGPLTQAYRARGNSYVATSAERIFEASQDRRICREIWIAFKVHVCRQPLALIRFGFDVSHPDLHLTNGLNYDLKRLAATIEYRVKCLSRRDPATRLAALRELRLTGPQAAAALPELRKHEADPDPEFRRQLRETQLAAGIEAIPRLVAECKDPDAKKRYFAIGEIRHFLGNLDAMEALLAALDDKDAEVRSMAAASSEKFAWAAADRFLPPLMGLADSDRSVNVRVGATRSIAAMGAAARRAVPLLTKLVDDPELRVRHAASSALGSTATATPELQATLRRLLAEVDGPVSSAAGTAGQLRITDAAMVKALVMAHDQAQTGGTTFGSDPSFVQSACCWALDRCAPDSPELPALYWRVLKNGEFELGGRYYAAEWLLDRGEKPSSVIEYLRQNQGAENLGLFQEGRVDRLIESSKRKLSRLAWADQGN